MKLELSSICGMLYGEYKVVIMSLFNVLKIIIKFNEKLEWLKDIFCQQINALPIYSLIKVKMSATSHKRLYIN